MAFLLNSQVQGASGKNKQSTPNAMARGPMQLHQLHRLKAGPGNKGSLQRFQVTAVSVSLHVTVGRRHLWKAGLPRKH